MTAALAVIFAAVASFLAWLRLRPVAPDTRAADAKAAMRESVADVKLSTGLHAIEERRVASDTLSDVDRLNALADSSRGRRGPL